MNDQNNRSASGTSIQKAPPSRDSQDYSPRMGPLTTPLSLRGWPVWAIYFLALLGLIYIFNPTAGIIEFIPDNFPIVGNLDEGVAFLMVWAGLVEFFEGRKYHQQDGEDGPD